MKLRYVAVLLVTVAVPAGWIAFDEHTARVKQAAYSVQEVIFLEQQVKIAAALETPDAKVTLNHLADLGREWVQCEQNYLTAQSDLARDAIVLSYVQYYKNAKAESDSLANSYEANSFAAIEALLALPAIDRDRFFKVDLMHLHEDELSALGAYNSVSDARYRVVGIDLDMDVRRIRYRDAHKNSLEGFNEDQQLYETAKAELERKAKLNQH